MFLRLNTPAATLIALLLAGCSKIPVPVHADLTIYAEIKTENESGTSMSELWSTDDCLGIYVRHNHKTGDTQPTATDNLKYTNSEEEASSTAGFTTEASFDICEGDLITGYRPYSSQQDRNTGSAAQDIIRNFTLGAQLQTGDNSTGHVEDLDFITAAPVTVSEAMLAEAPAVTAPLMFTHAFAAIKFELRNGFRRSMRIQKVVLESGDKAPLTGDYEINLITQSITALKPVPSAELTFRNAGRTDVNQQLTGHAVVNATTLAAGSTLTVSTSVGTFRTITTTDIPLERGHISTIPMTLSADNIVGEETTASVDNCIGSWKLTSFCNIPAEFDVYITIREDGTFTLYQRSADHTPVKFSGSYTFDPESRMFCGRYDDGAAWADSYIVEDADVESMVWVNAADKSEISEYTSSEIPESILGEI